MMAGHRGTSSVFVPQRHSWTREHANGGEAVRDEGRISERAGRGRKTHGERRTAKASRLQQVDSQRTPNTVWACREYGCYLPRKHPCVEYLALVSFPVHCFLCAVLRLRFAHSVVPQADSTCLALSSPYMMEFHGTRRACSVALIPMARDICTTCTFPTIYFSS